MVLAGIAAAIGPLVMMIGPLISGIAAIGIAINMAFLPTLGIVALVVAAFAAIVVAIILLYTKCEWFRNAVKKIMAEVVAVFKWLAKAVKAVIDFIVKHWKGLLHAFLIAIGPIGWLVLAIFLAVSVVIVGRIQSVLSQALDTERDAIFMYELSTALAGLRTQSAVAHILARQLQQMFQASSVKVVIHPGEHLPDIVAGEPRNGVSKGRPSRSSDPERVGTGRRDPVVAWVQGPAARRESPAL